MIEKSSSISSPFGVGQQSVSVSTAIRQHVAPFKKPRN